MVANLDIRSELTSSVNSPPHDSRIMTVEALGERLPLTLAVERAAKIVGVGRTAMYAAVRRGDFETIDLNGRLAVLTVPLLRRIGVELSFEETLSAQT